MGDVSAAPLQLIAVCGIDREVAKVRAFVDGCLTSGGRSDLLREDLLSLSRQITIRGLISVGVCGALDPALRTGEVVCARAIYDGSTTYPTDGAWTDRLIARTGAKDLSLALGLDRPAATPQAKADLFRVTTAPIVDMESQVVAAWAAELGVPSAVLRVVCDEAHEGIPAAAVAAMAADGSVDVAAVLRGLIKRPADLPPLLRLGRSSGIALTALGRAAAAAGPGLALD